MLPYLCQSAVARKLLVEKLLKEKTVGSILITSFFEHAASTPKRKTQAVVKMYFFITLNLLNYYDIIYQKRNCC